MGRIKVQLQVRITGEMLDIMDKHIATNPIYNTRAKWFAAAAEDWLTWIEEEADEDWVPYRAHSHGEKISISVMPDLKQRLEDASKGHQLVDIYWTVIIHFANHYKLTEFIRDPTPGVLNLSVPNETADVIDAYIEAGRFEDPLEFWCKALEYWFTVRQSSYRTHEFYFAPPVTDTRDQFLPLPRQLYHTLKYWSENDGVFPSVALYNAGTAYLDYLLEQDSKEG
jgi:hypothetical protein